MALYQSGKTKICIMCSIIQQIGGINVIHSLENYKLGIIYIFRNITIEF